MTRLFRAATSCGHGASRRSPGFVKSEISTEREAGCSRRYSALFPVDRSLSEHAARARKPSQLRPCSLGRLPVASPKPRRVSKVPQHRRVEGAHHEHLLVARLRVLQCRSKRLGRTRAPVWSPLVSVPSWQFAPSEIRGASVSVVQSPAEALSRSRRSFASHWHWVWGFVCFSFFTRHLSFFA
jgi:hypothetical protein